MGAIMSPKYQIDQGWPTQPSFGPYNISMRLMKMCPRCITMVLRLDNSLTTTKQQHKQIYGQWQHKF